MANLHRINIGLSFLLCLLIFPSFACADSIILKNGNRIDSERVWEEGDQIKCYQFGGIVGFPKGMVERIEIKKRENSRQAKQEEPYKSVINKLLPAFKGDNPLELCRKLSKFQGKGKYETTQDYKSRFDELLKSPLITRIYVFTREAKPFTAYDADKGILEIKANWNLLSLEREGSDYIGANAFGVEKRISSTKVTEINLDISNIEKVNKIVNVRPDRFFTYIDLKIGPAAAEKLEENIRLLYICKLIPDKDSQRKTHRLAFINRNPFISLDVSRIEPTLDFPYDETKIKYSLSVKLVELIAYVYTTGQILKRFGPF